MHSIQAAECIASILLGLLFHSCLSVHFTLTIQSITPPPPRTPCRPLLVARQGSWHCRFGKTACLPPCGPRGRGIEKGHDVRNAALCRTIIYLVAAMQAGVGACKHPCCALMWGPWCICHSPCRACATVPPPPPPPLPPPWPRLEPRLALLILGGVSDAVRAQCVYWGCSVDRFS